jgi:hypothetical protein
VRKSVGRIADLSKVISANPPHGNSASVIPKATHGGVTNEMPTRILTKAGALCLCTTVSSRTTLASGSTRGEGPCFSIQTDTEVLAHLIGASFERRENPSRARRGGA